MSQLNDVIEQSVRAQDAPFLVAMVGDKDGIRWSGSSAPVSRPVGDRENVPQPHAVAVRGQLDHHVRIVPPQCVRTE